MASVRTMSITCNKIIIDEPFEMIYVLSFENTDNLGITNFFLQLFLLMHFTVYFQFNVSFDTGIMNFTKYSILSIMTENQTVISFINPLPGIVAASVFNSKTNQSLIIADHILTGTILYSYVSGKHILKTINNSTDPFFGSIYTSPYSNTTDTSFFYFTYNNGTYSSISFFDHVPSNSLAALLIVDSFAYLKIRVLTILYYFFKF